MAEYSTLDYAERVKTRPRTARDLTGLSTGSSATDVLAAALFVFAAYALLVAQDVVLFTLAFLVFAFIYNPVRVQVGQRVVRDTSSYI